MSPRTDRPAPGAASASVSSEKGFTLIESLVALTILLLVMAGVMENMLQFSRTQTTLWNRANMRGAVRSATELLQQEVGQAGRVSLPPGVTMGTTLRPRCTGRWRAARTR